MKKQIIKISNFKFQISNSRKGFTFVELILYVSILTIILSAIIPFAWDVIGSSVKSATQQEVYAQARYVSERIKYEIRNAAGVNYVLGTALLSLSTSNPATNPTLIYRNNGAISIKQGTGVVTPLHSVNTTSPSLILTNYTSADNKTKNIRFEFTLESTFGSQNQKYKASTKIESAAEIRNN